MLWLNFTQSDFFENLPFTHPPTYWPRVCNFSMGDPLISLHIGKFFGRARRRSLRLAITTRTIGVERSFLLWAPDKEYQVQRNSARTLSAALTYVQLKIP